MTRIVHSGVTALIVLTAVVTLSAAIKFTSTFKSLDAGAVNFMRKKVAAMVITTDDSLRVAAEESLVRELSMRGIQAVATYRIAPKEELRAPETAKPWFEKAGIEGVMVLRPVSVDTQRTYSPSTWVSTSYSSLWSYYGYGWTTVWVPGGVQRETKVVVESTIYSLPLNQLLWGAVTESTNPRDLRGFVEELVKESVEQMQKQGLAKSQRR